MSAVLSPALLDQLLEELADRLAPRIAAELAGRQPQAEGGGEEWRLWPVEETARRLGRSERWVRDHKEAIGYIRLDGGALAFDPEDVRAFARARRVPLEDDDGKPARRLRAVGKGWLEA